MKVVKNSKYESKHIEMFRKALLFKKLYDKGLQL